MSEVMYKQCSLSRQLADGLATTVSWLPVRFAVVGRFLELLNDSGKWENGWHVDSAAGDPLPEKLIDKRPSKIWTNGTKDKKRKEGT